MNINITFRHMVATEAVKKHTHEKIAKLQKFLRQAMTAQVTLSVEGLDHTADVGISSGSAHFHATERSEDMYASIDMVLDKISQQGIDSLSDDEKRMLEEMSKELRDGS